ncbi:hypothetical protein WT14_19375 [Burkholderia stagnalis]|nr:hypothetical protein WT14_19375 [Burkholderia stagnalis]
MNHCKPIRLGVVWGEVAPVTARVTIQISVGEDAFVFEVREYGTGRYDLAESEQRPIVVGELIVGGGTFGDSISGHRIAPCW